MGEPVFPPTRWPLGRRLAVVLAGAAITAAGWASSAWLVRSAGANARPQSAGPTAMWTTPPFRRDGDPAIRLPWRLADDRGVTDLRAEWHLASRPNDPPWVTRMPLPDGGMKSAHGLSAVSLLAHPWAGLDVTVRLLARDGAGQTGASDPIALTLPERTFRNPIALDLIAARKSLSVTPEDHGDALEILDRLLLRPHDFDGDLTGWLLLAATYHLIVRDKSPEMIGEAQARLWDLAERIEEGRAADPVKAAPRPDVTADLLDWESALLERTEQRARASDRRPSDQRADARTQQALSRALADMTDWMIGLAADTPSALSRAGQAMNEAHARLMSGDDPGAALAQRAAIAALRAEQAAAAKANDHKEDDPSQAVTLIAVPDDGPE